MKTKLLAILLCVMLCVGTMPLTAAADTVYSVTYNLTNMTSTGPATVTQGNDLFAPLSTDDGYMMPDSVVVTVNGQELDTARYGIATVPFSGDVLILAEDVTGDIVITAEAIKRYDIHFIGEIYTARVPIPEGQSLNSYYRSPDLTREKEGHTFDGWFESTDGGETLADTPFDFDTVLTADVTLYPKWTPIATDTPDDTPASPDTGDTVTVLPAVLLMAASLSVITVAVRRKIGAKRHG